MNYKYLAIGLALVVIPVVFGYDPTAVILLFLWFVAPLFVGARIAQARNRNTDKALVVSFLFGWIGILVMWLALKTKVEKSDGSVYYK